MKKARKPCLPPGWYPRDPEKIAEFLRKEGEVSPPLQPASGLPLPPLRAPSNSAIASANGVSAVNVTRCRPSKSFLVEKGQKAAHAPQRPAGSAIAAIAPHAGWYYSGAIAAKAAAFLANGGAPETVAVIGGHLPGGAPPLFALEDAASTPLGELEIDTELRAALMTELGGAEDRWADNTVEVLLPMVKYFFPDSKLLWARFPADTASFEAGKALAAAAKRLGRSVKVLASTDLTHYGENYGFSPQGSGQKALDWVTTVNDRRFIEAVLSGESAETLARAETERSACSPGAVLGAMGFAAALAAPDGGVPGAELLDYGTSAAVSLAETGEIPASFVGYAAFAVG